MEKGDDAIGYVVLDRGTVTDGIDGGLGRAEEAEVRIGSKGVFIVLIGKFGGEASREGRLCFCMISGGNMLGDAVDYPV